MSAGLPKTMRAVVLDASGPPEALHIHDVPSPRLKPDHVILALDYASVGSWDGKTRSGAWGDVKKGTILGADGSGRVAAVGVGVSRLKIGDRVYSYSYGNADGGFYAEFVSVPADRVQSVPPQIDQIIGGAMPCVALTAYSGLQVLKIEKKSSLLVFGASGGVGSMAVWLASIVDGAVVTGTAQPDAHEYVRKLGAAHAIDPHSSELKAVLTRLAPATRGFDALLATSDADTLPQFLAHLREGAAFAYPNGVEPVPRATGHHGIGYDGSMSRAAFNNLNAAIGAKAIPLNVDVFPMDQVVDAHRVLDRGHVVGKIVLQIATPAS